MDSIRQTSRQLPVLIGNDHEHVMAKADIYRAPDKILIEIEARGPNSQLLAEFLEQAEPIALSFGAIPVRNIREKKENI